MPRVYGYSPGSSRGHGVLGPVDRLDLDIGIGGDALLCGSQSRSLAARRGPQDGTSLRVGAQAICGGSLPRTRNVEKEPLNYRVSSRGPASRVNCVGAGAGLRQQAPSDPGFVANAWSHCYATLHGPSIRNLHELGEDTVARPGMDEGDPQAVTAHPRREIDQLHAAAKLVERRGQIVDLVGNVVEALATLGHEPANRAFRIRGLDQLDRASRQREKGGAHALLGNVEPVRLAESKFLVVRDRGIEIGDTTIPTWWNRLRPTRRIASLLTATWSGVASGVLTLDLAGVGIVQRAGDLIADRFAVFAQNHAPLAACVSSR